MGLMFKIFNSGAEGSGATVIFSDGKVQQISQDNVNFGRVVSILTTTPVEKIDENELLSLIVPALGVGKSLTRLSERVSFDGLNILFDGDVVSDAIGDHILRILKEGGNADAYKALVAFMEKLYTNPSKSSRDSLYDFIVRHKITIDPDGDFYAYKGVKTDGGSIREGFGIVDGVSMNGSLPNKPGSILEIPRATVDANNANGCGVGLHAGTFEYASGWSRGLLLLVKINPRDVVSVPDCSSYQKIRTCRYKVVSHIAAKNTATTATVEVVEDSFDTLLRLNGRGEEVPVSFTYTRGNGEKINVALTVTEVRTTDDDVIIVGKDKDGEARNYRNTYISDLMITKSSPTPVVSAKISTDDFDALRKAIANGETVKCEFNYVTVDGEARSVKNFVVAEIKRTGWGSRANEVLVGEREDGQTRSYRLDRITDFAIQTPGFKSAPVVSVPMGTGTPLSLALLRATIATGESATVSFDYTKVDGEYRSVQNFVAEEIKSYNKELLVGTREDGETRTYRMDRIKNLVVIDAQVDDSQKVDLPSIQAAVENTVLGISVDKLKEIIASGEAVVVDFHYTTVAGEPREVKNFVADGITSSLLVGEREDGETRSYRLDRIEKVILLGGAK